LVCLLVLLFPYSYIILFWQFYSRPCASSWFLFYFMIDDARNHEREPCYILHSAVLLAHWWNDGDLGKLKYVGVNLGICDERQAPNHLSRIMALKCLNVR
jgi:hypothetical protein